jgi:RNA polymerase sigma factor (sigma-70 family)
MTDQKLIRQYVADGSQDAFRQIVTRYLKMVYATCLREMQNAEMAQDAAQLVFVLLAQKASRLRPGTVLSGWLFTTARFISKDRLRTARAKGQSSAARDSAVRLAIYHGPVYQQGGLTAGKPATTLRDAGGDPDAHIRRSTNSIGGRDDCRALVERCPVRPQAG